LNCLENKIKASKRLEFSSRANQTADGSGLKVDRQPLKCLLLVEELAPYYGMIYVNRLWINGP